MELPPSKYYGIRCPYCPAINWTSNQFTALTLCIKSYQDEGLPFEKGPMGIIIGHGKFQHVCKPGLND